MKFKLTAILFLLVFVCFGQFPKSPDVNQYPTYIYNDFTQADSTAGNLTRHPYFRIKTDSTFIDYMAGNGAGVVGIDNRGHLFWTTACCPQTANRVVIGTGTGMTTLSTHTINTTTGAVAFDPFDATQSADFQVRKDLAGFGVFGTGSTKKQLYMDTMGLFSDAVNHNNDSTLNFSNGWSQNTPIYARHWGFSIQGKTAIGGFGYTLPLDTSPDGYVLTYHTGGQTSWDVSGGGGSVSLGTNFVGFGNGAGNGIIGDGNHSIDSATGNVYFQSTGSQTYVNFDPASTVNNNINIGTGAAIIIQSLVNSTGTNTVLTVDTNGVSIEGATYGYMFPTTTGTAGQVMTTDGAGQASWQDGSATLANGRVGIGSASNQLIGDSGLRYYLNGGVQPILIVYDSVGSGGVETGVLLLKDNSTQLIVGLNVPNTLKADYNISWPDSLPTVVGQILVSDAGGNLSWQSQDLVAPYQYATPTTGQTVSSNGAPYLVINPAGTLLALTVNFPTAPVNGQKFNLACTQAVTGITLSAGGGTIDGTLTTIAANGTAGWIYIASITTWVKMHN